jgi:hypothetical protein
MRLQIEWRPFRKDTGLRKMKKGVIPAQIWTEDRRDFWQIQPAASYLQKHKASRNGNCSSCGLFSWISVNLV